MIILSLSFVFVMNIVELLDGKLFLKKTTDKWLFIVLTITQAEKMMNSSFCLKEPPEK